LAAGVTAGMSGLGGQSLLEDATLEDFALPPDMMGAAEERPITMPFSGEPVWSGYVIIFTIYSVGIYVLCACGVVHSLCFRHAGCVMVLCLQVPCHLWLTPWATPQVAQCCVAPSPSPSATSARWWTCSS
jgi:hypothetical protein